MSRRFTFSLEPLLQLRRARETAAALQLAHAQQDLERAQACVRELGAGFAETLESISRAGASRAAEFDRSAAAARLELARFQDRVRVAKADLATAMRDRKAVERLKERRQAEFSAEEARKEERELDEANHR